VNLALLVGVACAVLFFRAARYERMAPWAWTAASLGLTVILSMKSPSITLLLIVQVALFALMWWYNMRRQDRKPR
jgi:4-amino-4-deoxy-L-arabinose transferase-like glycosyltransferase